MNPLLQRTGGDGCSRRDARLDAPLFLLPPAAMASGFALSLVLAPVELIKVRRGLLGLGYGV